jgi:DNA polymerase/3'-5' exonuclease PolX
MHQKGGAAMSLNTGQQLLLVRAEGLANQVMEHLNPYCRTIGIVGSIRRKKKFVGDIEICCTPFMETGQFGFFEDSPRRSEKFIRSVAKLGSRIKGNASDGRYVQLFLYDTGLKLDLFIPQEHDFYRQYAIRTGSADYSSKVIATAWRKLGWVGTEHGLRREEYCSLDGPTWKWDNKDPSQELPPVWQSEREFFDWLQVPFRKPENREVNY